MPKLRARRSSESCRWCRPSARLEMPVVRRRCRKARRPPGHRRGDRSPARGVGAAPGVNSQHGPDPTELDVLRERIDRALDELRPFLRSDGGDITVVAVKDLERGGGIAGRLRPLCPSGHDHAGGSGGSRAPRRARSDAGRGGQHAGVRPGLNTPALRLLHARKAFNPTFAAKTS